jgi:hypothetical protein
MRARDPRTRRKMLLKRSAKTRAEFKDRAEAERRRKLAEERNLNRLSDEAKSLAAISGSAPNGVARQRFLLNRIKKVPKGVKIEGRIVIPAEVRHVPIEYALRRTIKSLMSLHGKIDYGTRSSIRKIIDELYKSGKFRFRVTKKRHRIVPESLQGISRRGIRRLEEIGVISRHREQKAKFRKKPDIKSTSRGYKKRQVERQKRTEEEALMPWDFNVFAKVDFSDAIKEIDAVLGKEMGLEFRNFFAKYLLEEARETHWYLTERSEGIVMDAREKQMYLQDARKRELERRKLIS